MKAVRNKLCAQNINFENSDNWKKLLTLLKEHEGNNKYFKTVTNFKEFITSDSQRSEEPVIHVQCSKLKRDDNFESIINKLKERNFDYGSNRVWRKLLTLLKEDEGDNKFFTLVTPIKNFKIRP